MSYQPQNFKDGQVLKAENLNTIEAGITALETQLQTVVTEMGATVEEFTEALPQFVNQLIDAYLGEALGGEY